MACPYFIPEQRCETELWQHRARLPLGDGFTGHCCAQPEPYHPAEGELREFCNIGYAKACPQLPAGRDADSVRFMAREIPARDLPANGGPADRGDALISIKYLLELGHAPVADGELRYDLATAQWQSPHPDKRVQTKAQCYLDSHLARRPAAARATAK